MRQEAPLYHYIRFTSNDTLSDPSKITNLTSTTIHYVSAKRSFLLRFHSWYGWRNQCTWPFWKYSVRHSSTQVILIHLECHIVIPAKSQIDLSKNNTGIQLRETNSSATNVNTFEQINLRDLLDIPCQTFVHTSCPGTGQTEGTIQYIHLSHCYLRLIQQPLHFTPSSIYLW